MLPSSFCQAASVGSAMLTDGSASRDVVLIHRVETVVHRGLHLHIQLSGNYLENALRIVRHSDKPSAGCTSSLGNWGSWARDTFPEFR